jgi:DNA-directed RNA polymerase specialized sigma24 family protein
MGRPILELPEQTQQHLRDMVANTDQEALNAYLLALDIAGWGYQPAARALGRPRETIRSWALRGSQSYGPLPPVPEVPKRPVKPEPPSLTAKQAQRLATLNRKACQLHPRHSARHPFRVASEELSALLAEHRRNRISYEKLGAAMGVAPSTVRARLRRHGYLTVSPSLTPYRGRAHEVKTA